MTIKKKALVAASGDFRKFSINIEAQGISVNKRDDKWSGDKIVDFDDETINIRMTFKGPEGGEYKVTITINSIEKIISGTFANEGLNHVPKDYQLIDFLLTLA